jgi:hypothetical protein
MAEQNSKFPTLTFLLIVLCALVYWSITGSSDKNAGQSPSAPAPPPDPHTVALQSTSITKFSRHKEGFGNVMEATFTIKNDGEMPVKDIQVRCTHSAPSGTVIDSNERTIYEIVAAHKSRTFHDFNMGFIDSQAARSSCEISDLSLVQ